METCNFYEANNGRAVAEDGFVWIHKDATYSALALLLHQDDSDVIKRFSTRLTKLLDNAVTPFFVFDGKHTSAKLVNADRATSREKLEQRHWNYTVQVIE